MNRRWSYLSEFGGAAKPASPTLAGAERMVDSDQSDTEPEKDGQQNHAFLAKNKCLAAGVASTQPLTTNGLYQSLKG
jgi:hypothetical protein